MKKEEREMTQMKDCTFRPKINSNYNVEMKKTVESKERNKNRIDVLYKKGMSSGLAKKDKTTEEYEVEKNHKECTFRPYLEKYQKL